MVIPTPHDPSRTAGGDTGPGPTVEVHDDPTHGLVARKRGPTQRIHREIAVLGMCTHPGVVRQVTSETVPDDGGDTDAADHEATTELTTHWVGGHSLATVPRPSPEECAGLLAALATTVADLHDGGVVHGAIVADHVLLDRSGRPVLCSLGAATAPGIDALAHPAAPSDDIAALGELLHDLLGADADEEPLPGRRFGRRREWRRHQRRALRNLADLAIDDDPDRRPNARRFAASIADAVPEAVLPPPPGDADDTDDPFNPDTYDMDPYDTDGLERLRATMTEPRPRRSRDRRRLTVAGGVLAVVLVALGGRALLTGDTATPALADAATPVTDAGETPPPCPNQTPDGPALDVDGDGCPDPIDIDGIEVTVGEQTWQVGADGDTVAVGDWDCDGQATPAVLRPTTGEVFLFNSWAAPDAEVAVSPAAVHLGAIELAQTQVDACSTLEVIDDAGISTRITPPTED